jgi:integrase
MGMKQIKPGVWSLDVHVDVGGNDRRKRETFTGGENAAKARYWEIWKELQERAKQEPRSLTLTAFKHILDYYLERHPANQKVQSYFYRMKEKLGNVEISELRIRFEKFLLLLRHTKGIRTKRPLSNQTVNHYLKYARAAINCCVIGGVLEDNPIKYFRYLPTYPRERMLTEDEKRRLLETVRAKAPHLYPIVLFALLVPSRRGELTTLKRTDYDMVNNCITIPGERTKNKRPCIKPVPTCLTEYMRSVPVESEYLFYRRDWRGRYLSLGDFRRAFKRCLRIAGIENYRFHDSRRGAYTDLLLAGNAPHVVMQVSGHQTDMSKVYFGRNELLAAKSINFGSNQLDSAIGHLKVVTA